MLLAVDIGNTQTVIGVFDGHERCTSWRLSSDTTATSDQILIQLHQLISIEEGLDCAVITQAIVSSVVPSLTLAWERAINRLIGHMPRLVDASVDYGLPIKYKNPREIGPDRISDAVAALAKYGPSTIVVDLGTATNIEVIDKDGAFLGGVIAPGLQVSADALFASAARLAQIDLEVPPQVVGTTTKEAVQAGLTFGEVARIDGLVQMIKRELGEDSTVVATGGLHTMIAPISTTIDHCDPDLTLDGLRLINDMLDQREQAGA